MSGGRRSRTFRRIGSDSVCLLAIHRSSGCELKAHARSHLCEVELAHAVSNRRWNAFDQLSSRLVGQFSPPQPIADSHPYLKHINRYASYQRNKSYQESCFKHGQEISLKSTKSDEIRNEENIRYQTDDTQRIQYHF